MQSVALRSLDKTLADEKGRLARSEKMLSDFQEQLGKPFEYEARIKELLAKQAELNAALDLDKGERQVATEEEGDPDESDDRPAPRSGAQRQPRETRAGDKVCTSRRRCGRGCDDGTIKQLDVSGFQG
jgi:hypothetical protein